ncbi:M13 family metallopeptidase [Metamycoplasma canadense]|uniref:Endopeptidase O n=1 Tax=Metamycoplasma canadense TaxID=29554 RepID=A0A077LB39_9BACT|nr:M13 family metallopeptidase [Metamycoplasma canadense]BAP39404.1 endopeptidase O [Metamycoplasma canadense]
MNKKLIKEDFFQAINGEWLSKHEIPNDKTSIGSFERLDENLTNLKSRLLNKWVLNNEEISNNQMLVEMIKLFKLVNNWSDRKANGIKPILPILESIEKLENWKDLEKVYVDYTLNSFELPINFGISSDFKNEGKETLFAVCPSVILPEKNYYSDEEKKNSLYKIWVAMAKKLLLKIKKDEKWVENLINKALIWDTEASKYILSAEEWAIVTNIYNPKKISELDKKVTELKWSKIINNLLNKEIEEVICVSNNLIDDMALLIKKENFENYKAFLYITTLISLSPYLDYNSQVISSEFRRILVGQQKPTSKKRSAVKLVADNIYKMVFGKYYGETYFGKDNKKNVENMISKMIKIYENRLKENNWLSEKTKEKAILKLSKVDVYVGYPEIIDEFYEKLIVKKYNGFDDLLNNIMEFNKIKNQFSFASYGKKKNKDLWSMTPAMVNAYYNPTNNKIVFPAGILQAPFYSSKQSSSENYGGIGVVIAHEISHAFDNNGANFDENGMMNSWWTEQDKIEFEKRAEKMVKLFEGRKTDAGKCNGKLTVSENIADAGGVSCALEAAKSENDFNAKKFFINYAINWRSKYRKELQKLLLDTDVHAPCVLRTNVQVQNSDDFYTAFNIKKGDKMYLDPKKRVKIW